MRRRDSPNLYRWCNSCVVRVEITSDCCYKMYTFSFIYYLDVALEPIPVHLGWKLETCKPKPRSFWYKKSRTSMLCMCGLVTMSWRKHPMSTASSHVIVPWKLLLQQMEQHTIKFSTWWMHNMCCSGFTINQSLTIEVISKLEASAVESGCTWCKVFLLLVGWLYFPSQEKRTMRVYWVPDSFR